MGAVAASGGYYIACAAQRVYANPGTITGSIGVIMPFMNVKDLVEKIGVKGMTVKSGAFKDMGSPMRDMTPQERELLQGVVDNVHLQFVNAVAAGRNLNREDVLRIADGRIFTGEQAKGLGLVDVLGNLEDAIAEGRHLTEEEDLLPRAAPGGDAHPDRRKDIRKPSAARFPSPINLLEGPLE
jgi:protease-4